MQQALRRADVGKVAVPPEYTRKELLVDGAFHAMGVSGSLGGFAVMLSYVLPAGAGGVLYTVGVAFHLWESLPQHNSLWHASVLAAAACHYVAVFEVLIGW